ncbi:MAG: methyltransferase domain-containing protein [Nitrospiraceae bacterium]|nr:methyltransferase domain-containing protein [Nitrospiraceae bacterium]
MSRQNQLKEGVKKAYSLVAEMPSAKHPFPSGRNFAESIGYPAALLDSIPASAYESFTGASNVSVFADITAGSVVLDLGCGAGLDAIIASRKTGKAGRVICLDFSETMLAKARMSASAAGCSNIEFLLADAESLPLPDSLIDIAIVNGILNLNPERSKIFSELSRVVKSGGSVYAAELVYNKPRPKSACSIEDWFT